MHFPEALMGEIRARFAHVDTCPFTGPRIFFENAGGALTLKSVVETSAKFAAIPDNQGRANPASQALQSVIDTARADMAGFFNAPAPGFFVGESGTELTFRLIRSAITAAGSGKVLGSTLEHPASRSACRHWAKVLGRDYVPVPHDDATGTVSIEDYLKHMSADVSVATIVHTSPVTGMSVDVAGIAAAIRDVNPACFIIVDGIQHACHGGIDINSYGIDGYVISPYKVFSRHGYGLAWVSERMRKTPHECLVDGPQENFELGTRDTGAFAAFSDVVAYFDWLGGECGKGETRRARIEYAGRAIHDHETRLTDAVLFGIGNQTGLAEMNGVTVIGGTDNPAREGLVSFAHDTVSAFDIVETLNAAGIRCHVRKADHYSGNILTPLGLEACVRVSFCHYNTEAEVAEMLAVLKPLLGSVGN